MNTSDTGACANAPAQQTLPPARPRVRRVPPQGAQPRLPLPTPSEPDVVHHGGAGGYEVGYKKPPKSTQFKKGQSGNPKGRPRGAKGMNTLIREMMTEKVPVRTANGVKRMTIMETILRKKVEQAHAGNARAAAELIKLYAAAVPEACDADPYESAQDLTATDLAILAALGLSTDLGSLEAEPQARAEPELEPERELPMQSAIRTWGDLPDGSREKAADPLEANQPECGSDWDRSLV